MELINWDWLSTAIGEFNLLTATSIGELVLIICAVVGGVAIMKAIFSRKKSE